MIIITMAANYPLMAVLFSIVLFFLLMVWIDSIADGIKSSKTYKELCQFNQATSFTNVWRKLKCHI